MLTQLGSGATIADVCTAAGIQRDQFDAWWQTETRRRVPETAGSRRLQVRQPVRIDRDAHGIPHIHAENDDDLFFAFGYAQAQDRLFQLDFLRRRGSGRLAEVLGGDGSELDLLSRVVGPRSLLELDLLARTVGLRRSAERAWQTLPADVQSLVTAFSRGINAWIEECGDRLPIEFDLLDYRPEPWTPIDCLTIEIEFAWYLTGRFPVIVIPEMIKRGLGDGPLYRAFLQVEADAESIVPGKSHTVGTPRVGPAPSSPPPVEPGEREGPNDSQACQGSNNWVVSGALTATGKPLLASDPHIAFEAVSCWYEAHLAGGSFNVAGIAYVGMPALLFGRNERVAWGCTNNICSQRDLYLEKTDPARPDHFLFDGRWEPAQTREEVIQVKGAAPVHKTIRSSRNGPIVNEVLPSVAREHGPIALRWLGFDHGGWLTAVLNMNRARSADEFREAVRPWHVPTFSMVFADVDGHIGYHAVGRIPIRNLGERGYRPGWDPQHQWQGFIPFDEMPHLADPERGWIATANNRPSSEDFPYPLSGTWADGLRARRIRQMIEGKNGFTPAAYAQMHCDVLSLRATCGVPALLKVLASNTDDRIQQALTHLRNWDCRMEPDRVGATLFEVFFTHWTRTVLRARLDAETARFVAGGANGLSAALLEEDSVGWFAAGKREEAIAQTLRGTLDWLTEKLGPDMQSWTWGRLHVLPLKHVLSGRGELGELLDHGGLPVPGNAHTVCNTGLGPNFESRLGANYRLIADLSSPTLLAVDSQSQSGHPGSEHYSDQFATWLAGEYHTLPLDEAGASRLTVKTLRLEPR